MSTHIGAEPGAIAPYVLMPGDPLRAKYLAETFLEDAVLYNEVRGMYGYTGTYKGVRVSAQGSGMGQPSMAIYATELLREYGVEAIVRVGTAGAISERARIRDVVIGLSASTDSSMNRVRFGGADYAPAGDFDLMRYSWDVAQEHGFPVIVGGLFSSDQFYHPRPEIGRSFAEHGALAVEMEASALYTIAAAHAKRALALCTISDHVLTGEQTTAEERQQTFADMMVMALEAIVRLDAQRREAGQV